MKSKLLSIAISFLFLSFGFSFTSYSQSKKNLILPKIKIIDVKTGTKNPSGTGLYVFNNCYFKDYDASDFMLDEEITLSNPGFPNKTRKIQGKSWNDILDVMDIHMAKLGYALKDFKDLRTEEEHLELIIITYEK